MQANSYFLGFESNSLQDDNFISNEFSQHYELFKSEIKSNVPEQKSKGLLFLNNATTKQGQDPYNQSEDEDMQPQQGEVQNIGILRKQKKKSRIISKWPGESKNIAKNLGRGLKRYIKEEISASNDVKLKKLQEDKDWLEFEQLRDISKQELDIFLKTEVGSLFGKEYFGQCLWNQFFLKENKTEVSIYFRYNEEFFATCKADEKID